MQLAMFEGAPERASDDRFEVFWRAYPATRRLDKIKARAAFLRAELTDDDWRTLQRVLPLQAASSQWQEHPRWIPHPTTYLNNRRWRDDPAVYAATPPTAAELHAAHRIRQNARGGCPHAEPCDSWRTCIDRIVATQRGRA